MIHTARTEDACKLKIRNMTTHPAATAIAQAGGLDRIAPVSSFHLLASVRDGLQSHNIVTPSTGCVCNHTRPLRGQHAAIASRVIPDASISPCSSVSTPCWIRPACTHTECVLQCAHQSRHARSATCPTACRCRQRSAPQTRCAPTAARRRSASAASAGASAATPSPRGSATKHSRGRTG